MFLSRLVILSALTPVVAAQATNVGPTGTATQSSNYTGGGGAANLAIDGNTDGNWTNGSVTHTDTGVGEWWEAQLPQVELVHEVRVWNRTDSCCIMRLVDFEVTISLANVPMSTTTHPGFPAEQFVSIDLGAGVVCDHIRVEMKGSTPNPLSLAEVEMLRYDLPILNVAPLGVATQSTTRAAGGAASRAIDGNTNSNFFSGNSVSHTDNQAGDWWQVELPWEETIQQIRLFNRGDCCGNRLSNFRLSVFQGATEVFGQDYFATTGNVPQGGILVVDPPAGTRGDRVRVGFLGPNRASNYVLSLAEVQVLRFGAALNPDVVEIADTVGSKQVFELDAGRDNAGKTFLLLGSITGTQPGITLSGVNTPLNIDPYFLWTLENPNFPPLTNSRATLDIAGRATAEFTIPTGAPSLQGLTLHHAYAVVGTTAILDAASNAAILKIK